jgi:hypothetical protein
MNKFEGYALLLVNCGQERDANSVEGGEKYI